MTQKHILNRVAVLEMFEEAEGREVSIEDLPAVLKLRKELCEARVQYLRIEGFFIFIYLFIFWVFLIVLFFHF